MRCDLSDLGKSYNYHPIFRSLTYTLESAKNYVILGGNGSGKSTLLKIIAGGTDSNEGKIEYSSKGKNIDRATLPEYISFCSPYMDLIEELGHISDPVTVDLFAS